MPFAGLVGMYVVISDAEPRAITAEASHTPNCPKLRVEKVLRMHDWSWMGCRMLPRKRVCLAAVIGSASVA